MIPSPDFSKSLMWSSFLQEFITYSQGTNPKYFSLFLTLFFLLSCYSKHDLGTSSINITWESDKCRISGLIPDLSQNLNFLNVPN